MDSTIKFKKSNRKANLRRKKPASSTASSSDSDDSIPSQDDIKPKDTPVKRLKTNTSAQESKTTPSQDLFPTPFAADRAYLIASTNDAANSARAVGPVKRPTNVRTTVTTDFSPDVCKDYKQTGFCGFGDNCKFLHSREDYKQGWQLDHEWETVTRGITNIPSTVVASINSEKGKEEEDGDEESFLDSIPFDCIICSGLTRTLSSLGAGITSVNRVR